MKTKHLLVLIFLLSSLIFSQSKTWDIAHFGEYPNDLQQIRMSEFVDGQFELQWTTDLGNYDRFTIGDCNNDGEDELIFSKSDSIIIVNNRDFNDIEIIIPGIDNIVSLHVADVTGDGLNELIFAKRLFRGQFFVYKYISGIYQNIYQDSCMIFHLSIGDVDNDGINEILLPESGRVRIIKFDGSLNTFKTNLLFSQGLNDVAIVGDVDNDGLNEVVVGGNHKQARIFQFDANNFNQIYSLTFDGSVPQNGNGYTQGIAVGDVNGDNKNELLVGTTWPINKIHVFKIQETNSNISSVLEWSTNIRTCNIPGIYLSDYNNDGIIDFCIDEEWNSRFLYYQGNGLYEQLSYSNFRLSKTLASEFTLSNSWKSYFIKKFDIIPKTQEEFYINGTLKNFGVPLANVTAILKSSNSSIQIIDSLLSINNLPYLGSLNIKDLLSFKKIADVRDPILNFTLDFYKEDILLVSEELNLPNPYSFLSEVSASVGVIGASQGSTLYPIFTDLNNDNKSDIFISSLTNAADRLIYWSGNGPLFSSDRLTGKTEYLAKNCFTDINNDLQLEIIETGGIYTNIWEKDDYTFIEISRSLGISQQYSELTSFGVNSFDYNNDGLLDIFLTATQPHTPHYLFRNNGNDSFTDVSNSVGISSTGYGQTVVSGDINNDGLIDIYIGSYNTPNLLYIAELSNDSSIVYIERAQEFGVDFVGDYMAASFADINNDSYLDLLVLGWDRNVPSYLLLNDSGESFIDISIASGFNNYHGIDIALFDYNHDEFIDVITGGNQFAEGNKISILINNGDMTFNNIVSESGIIENDISRYFSVSDFNNDGRADILITSYNAPIKLYKNNLDSKNWIAMKLRGIENNSLAIGAKVELIVNGVSQFREVNSNSGNDTQLYFGLGNFNLIDSVIVNWPNGKQTVFENISSNKSVVLVENGEIIILDGDETSLPGSQSPNSFKLMQNYPNPFNPTTLIEYHLTDDSQINLTIYDILGKKINTIVNEYKQVGVHQIRWNGKNSEGHSVAGGIYFYKLQAGDFIQTRKMVLLK